MSLAVIALYLISTLSGLAEGFVERFFLPVAFVTLLVLATVGCGGEALRDRRDRLAWLLFGVGIGLWTIAAASRNIFFDGTESRPIPAWIDPLFLAFYPAVFAGLILVIRGRMRRFNNLPWLDGLAGILMVVALSLTFLHGRVQDMTGGDTAETVVLLAYPLGDLVLLALLAVLLKFNGPGREGPWLPMTIGLGFFAVADILFAVAAPGSGTIAAPVWALWMLGVLFVVVSTWRDDGDVREVTPGHQQLLFPLAFTVAVVVILIVGQTRELMPAALISAIAVLVVVLIRLLLSARENAKLFDSRRSALTDELTGLASRRHLNERIKAIGPDEPSSAPVNVTIINLNRFKELNSALGHRAGDVLLSAVGARLNRSVARYGLLGRFGGDEFLLIAECTPKCPDSAEVARDIQRCLAPPFFVDGLRVHIDAAIGSSGRADPGDEGSELVRRADVAMREAKSREEPFVEYSGAESAMSRERLKMLEEFRLGLEREELVLFFQPKVRLADRTVASCEALMRWDHPDGGIISPFEFLQMAESAGLMHQVTGAVIRMTIEQMVAWRSEGIELSVALNLAMPNLLDTALPGRLCDQLEEAGIDPPDLTVEITENIVMSDPERVLANLDQLRDVGIRISLDDFGSGNTSLSYLRRLPLDEVKMDRGLVGDMVSDPKNAAIAKAAIEITHELGLSVVAEGVEEQETVRVLTDLECHEIQGYVFAKPMPAAEIPGWLAAFQQNGAAGAAPAVTS
ncbi:MAG TPA: bifunctional diguanylate cyclase/phosphodiesterase [Solirubrobacterales bacterium]|nr:bifunctional diguanylate cyclase/phosphodiesterase [Solirubrobacterales bacterium]